ncbi:hypothetical protein CC2G_012849 [Coprinopsis cinerea AmutBmut pab1-1]|nr:hypothetical protein CC2G_012849 [Coprinopsis cinerea AmutBmut pab1-1]
MQRTKKPPPANKRHTKPCKYFQLGSCSLSAESCNFAHVVVAPPLPTKGASICRYYSTGTCHNGTYCPYGHSNQAESPYQPRIHIAGQEPRGEWQAHSTSPIDSVYLDAPPMYGNYPSAYSPYHHEWSYAAGISAQPPPGYPSNYITPPSSGAQPNNNQNPFTLGSKSSIPDLSTASSKGHPAPGFTSTARDYPHHSPYHYPHIATRSSSNDTTSTATTDTTVASSSSLNSGSDDTGSSSFSSSSTDSDSIELIVATTEDPQYPERRHEHQSQVVVADPPGPEHVPPFVVSYPRGGYPFQPHRPMPGSYNRPNRAVSQPTTFGSARTVSRNSGKPKPSKYKTKPCKFWALNKTCAAGDDCTFRHDEPLSLPNPGPPPGHRYSPSPPRLEAPRPRAASQHKDNKFFPISWRVIGGGVLVGGSKER